MIPLVNWIVETTPRTLAACGVIAVATFVTAVVTSHLFAGIGVVVAVARVVAGA